MVSEGPHPECRSRHFVDRNVLRMYPKRTEATCPQSILHFGINLCISIVTDRGISAILFESLYRKIILDLVASIIY